MSNLINSILPRPPRPIIVVQPGVSIQQCIQMMTEENIGALVVSDDDNLLGIISERDIVYGLASKGKDLLNFPVSEVLCANVMVLRPTDSIETAMTVITETKRRHVLIAEEGKLVAIISIGDLLRHMLDNHLRTIADLESYILH